MSVAPHPALSASSHLLPALHTFIPALRAHFDFSKRCPVHLSTYTSYYTSSDPLHPALLFCAIVTAFCWVAGEVTGNVSQVDRLWTFLPILYTAHFALHAWISGASGAAVPPRLALLLGLQVLWMLRLSYNTWRRGLFSPSSEDYRWPILRRQIPSWLFKLFSLFFIAITQNVLLAATALPQYVLLTSASPSYRAHSVARPIGELTVWDALLAALFVLNLVLEFVADGQQWEYQTFKHAGLDHGKEGREQTTGGGDGSTRRSKFTAEDRARGFVTSGLWAWSRHPNFAREQTVWWLLYAFTWITFVPSFSVLLSPSDPSSSSHVSLNYGYLVNYSIIAPLAMSALFLASTRFTEQLSASKYPAYKEYQKRVGMFWLPDTLLRSLHYRYFASQSQRERVEKAVWGRAVGTEREKVE